MALLARDACETASNGTGFAVFSLFFPNYRHLAGEAAVLEQVLSQEPGLAPHRIDAGGMTAFQKFFDPPPHAEPWPWLSWSETGFALNEAAPSKRA